MCGRYKGPDTWAQLHAVLSGFTLPMPIAMPAEYRPTNKVPIVLPTAEGYEVAPARWSLVPSWYRKELKDWKVATFNARLEDIADKATFNGPWSRRQFCLMPASCFWEWSGPHPSGAKGKKQRWRINRADNHELVFGGLYDNAQTADGLVTSCTLLMHAAGADMQPMHDREPVILHPDEWEPFLAGRLDRDLQNPVPPGTLRISPETAFE